MHNRIIVIIIIIEIGIPDVDQLIFLRNDYIGILNIPAEVSESDNKAVDLIP